MKIGIDIRCLTEPQYSGISEYTYNLLNNLFKIDSQNQYFLFYNSAKKIILPKFDFNNVIIKGFHYPNKLFNLSLRFLKIAEIDKMIGGVDLFLIPNFLFLNLSPDCKKVLIVHDLSFELYPEFFTFKKRLWHKLTNPKRLCQQADKIIAISQNTKNDLVNLYQIPTEKIEVIYPGISDVFFQPINEAEKIRVRDKYCLPKDYIFYLGNLEPRKNLESLILALEKIKDRDIHLVIAGGQAWKYKNIYNIWQKSLAKKRIKFLGYIDSANRAALYSLAKIFVYPSIYEGFGLPVVEAMACGTPVISSFSSSLPEAVGDSGLMVDPNNFNDLAQVINQLLTDQKLTQDLINKGKKRASQFNWSITTQRLLEIFNNLK